MPSYICQGCRKEVEVSPTYWASFAKRNQDTLCKGCQSRVKKETELPELATRQKVCSQCKLSKPLLDFPGRSDTVFSKSRRCNECVGSAYLLRKQRDPEWFARVKNNAKKSHLLRTYNITLAQHEALLAAFGHCCGVCGSKSNLCVDHCHKNGHIRGVLCKNCNKGIGIFGDNVELLAKAKEYLDANQSGERARAAVGKRCETAGD